MKILQSENFSQETFSYQSLKGLNIDLFSLCNLNFSYTFKNSIFSDDQTSISTQFLLCVVVAAAVTEMASVYGTLVPWICLLVGQCFIGTRCGQAPSRQCGPGQLLHCGGSPFSLGRSLNSIERDKLPVFENYVIVVGPLISVVFKLLSKMLGTLKFFVKEALH